MIKTNTAAFGMTLFSGVVVLSIARSRRQSSISLPGSSPSAYGTLHLDNGNANDGEIVGLLPWRSAISKMPEDETSASSCELKIVNNFDEPVLLCWVDEKGAIRSHRRVNDTSISDGSVSNEHLEYTFVGHSFVCIRECDPLPKSMNEVTLESFLFVYTLALGRARHLITLSSYTPRFFSHRHHKVIVNLQCVPMQSDEDEKLIDTSSKVYNTREICGFTVHTEEGLDACLPELLATIQKDLEVVVKLLPPIACEKLQQSTPFWVNKTHTYGKVSSPVEGRHMCYHPIGGTVWLQKNGMALNKEGCIEMYCAADYLEDRHLWGDGGVLLHELSHAFHNKFCPNGFDCAEIEQLFRTAMKANIYDKVRVHGPQGKDGRLCKHYACTNSMEFWAELSVAYHWKLDGVTEYNKWYPFNNSQLHFHDPETWAVLDKYWKQFE